MVKPTPLIQRITKMFRGQPIVSPDTLQIKGLELLKRGRPRFGDNDYMLRVDIQAAKAAAFMARATAFDTVHCNVEIWSMLRAEWIEEAAYFFNEKVTLEIVERNVLLSDSVISSEVAAIIKAIKKLGATIAMDDFEINDHNKRALEIVQPQIVKIDSASDIRAVRNVCDAAIVVERIETEEMAQEAMRAGADFIQGYYCDRQVANRIPSEFTLPGVMAQEMFEQQRALA